MDNFRLKCLYEFQERMLMNCMIRGEMLEKILEGIPLHILEHFFEAFLKKNRSTLLRKILEGIVKEIFGRYLEDSLNKTLGNL